MIEILQINKSLSSQLLFFNERTRHFPRIDFQIKHEEKLKLIF